MCKFDNILKHLHTEKIKAWHNSEWREGTMTTNKESGVYWITVDGENIPEPNMDDVITYAQIDFPKTHKEGK